MSSCNASRFLPDDQSLVRKVQIKGIDKKFSEQAYLYVQKDSRPNSRINLFLYNIFNTKKGAYRTKRIRKIGEAPNILDSSLVDISKTQIQRFLKSKGYFKAEVISNITVKNKKASIVFTAVQGPEFRLRNIEYLIPDTFVAAIYHQNRESFTHLHAGERYDSDSLNYEREQIFQMMKRNGYYDYVRQYVRFDVDSNLYSSQADLKLYIANPKEKDLHQVYTISKGIVTIKTSNGENAAIAPDTVMIDSQFRFVDHSGKFNPALINRYIFIKEDNTYDISKEDLTYDRLYDLNVFKNIKIGITT